MAIKVANSGLTPLVIKVTATAPPRGKLPSVVISGKFKILKVIKIPRPKMDQKRPCEIIEIIIFYPNFVLKLATQLRLEFLSLLPYSITCPASLRASSGTVIPSSLAFFLLMTDLPLLKISTGVSSGFAPFKILAAIFPVATPRSY